MRLKELKRFMKSLGGTPYTIDEHFTVEPWHHDWAALVLGDPEIALELRGTAKADLVAEIYAGARFLCESRRGHEDWEQGTDNLDKFADALKRAREEVEKAAEMFGDDEHYERHIMRMPERKPEELSLGDIAEALQKWESDARAAHVREPQAHPTVDRGLIFAFHVLEFGWVKLLGRSLKPYFRYPNSKNRDEAGTYRNAKLVPGNASTKFCSLALKAMEATPSQVKTLLDNHRRLAEHTGQRAASPKE